jgi:nitroimidazol reductase NimA-like FMN-containing flavoprotein (pyridoxamine 5'-phosphate oxidase superfamily)
LNDRQIEDVLRTCSVGHIGCRAGDDVYVVPVSYVYADRSVYGHCADGRKLTAMRRDPRVCFEVEDVRGLAEWTSVVATGRFEELHGEHARTALDLFRARFAPDEPVASVHGHGTSHPPVLFRIHLLSWSGRFACPGAEHPAAPRSDVMGHGVDRDTLARLMGACGPSSR